MQKSTSYTCFSDAIPMAKVRRTKSELTRERILAAATKVVGSVGYDKASITRIAAKARLAAGGFYYYFDTRKELFDQLLPALGQDMIAFIAERLHGVEWGIEREVRSFEVYLEYLRRKPEFYRVFSEAYVYAPKAYEKHMRTVIDNYCGALRVQRLKGHLDVAEDDLPMLAHFLIGIRNYASQFYMERGNQRSVPPERTIDLYRRLIVGSVFRDAAKRDPSRDTPSHTGKFVQA
jgi:AcrR family transcriptional regulator